jgi:hypothetical protein
MPTKVEQMRIAVLDDYLTVTFHIITAGRGQDMK